MFRGRLCSGDANVPQMPMLGERQCSADAYVRRMPMFQERQCFWTPMFFKSTYIFVNSAGANILGLFRLGMVFCY